MTPSRIAPWEIWVQVGGTFPPDGGGSGGDTTATRGGGVDSPGRGLGRQIQDGRLTDGEDPEDVGMAVRAPLHSQWYRVRGVVMEVFPITEIRHQSI